MNSLSSDLGQKHGLGVDKSAAVAPELISTQINTALYMSPLSRSEYECVPNHLKRNMLKRFQDKMSITNSCLRCKIGVKYVGNYFVAFDNAHCANAGIYNKKQRPLKDRPCPSDYHQLWLVFTTLLLLSTYIFIYLIFCLVVIGYILYYILYAFDF